jgi:hypothetical protein
MSALKVQEKTEPVQLKLSQMSIELLAERFNNNLSKIAELQAEQKRIGDIAVGRYQRQFTNARSETGKPFATVGVPVGDHLVVARFDRQVDVSNAVWEALRDGNAIGPDVWLKSVSFTTHIDLDALRKDPIEAQRIIQKFVKISYGQEVTSIVKMERH